MKNIKIYINIFIISILSCSILFFTFKDIIGINKYIVLTVILWIIIRLNFKRKMSEQTFEILSTINIGSSIAFLLIKLFYSRINGIDEKSHYQTLFIVGFNVFLLLRCMCVKYKVEDNNDKKELFRKRKFDLERIKKYLNSLNIIAINAQWGDGKSFLVNKLKEDIKKQYEIIEIDVLSCNLDELQIVLIKEIEKILYENKMLSLYSKKLRNFINGESKIKDLFGINLIDNYTYLEIIKGFKNELNKLGKKILIIYEDLDRISDKDIIKNIFALSESIADEHVKVLYEYDERNLEKLEFDNNYLEKYMPYKINLTKLSFFEILKIKLKEMNINEKIVCFKDFEFLKTDYMQFRFNYLDNFINRHIELKVELDDITIRRIEHFLAEINTSLQDNNENNIKEIVISFYYLKHCIPEGYNKLISNKDLFEVIKFKVKINDDIEEYSILEMIQLLNNQTLDEEYIKGIFDDYDNRLNYFILKLFNFNIAENIIQGETGDERLLSINTESRKNLLDRDGNEKKNRTIWWLLESGKSKITDYENEADMVIKNILSKETDEEMIQAYHEFCSYMYKLDREEYDNGTTQKMGEEMFIEIFKAFNIRDITEENQLKLLLLYFKEKNIHNVSDKVIHILNYCKLRSRTEYINILKEFNKLNIIGNFNNKKYFLDFIIKYIGAFSNQKIGFCTTFKLSSISNEDDNSRIKTIIIRVINDFKETLNNKRDSINRLYEIEEINNDFDVVIEFLNKLLVLINNENEFEDNRSGVHTDRKCRNFNEDELGRLRNMYENHDPNLEEEIRKSYKEEKITTYELAELSR